MDKAYITRLLQLYFTNQATHAEREALFAELEQYKNNEDWVEIHTSLLSQAEEIKEYDPQHYQTIINTILKPKTKVIPLYRRNTFKWIAAACIILLLGIATYFILSGVEEQPKQQQTAQTRDIPAPSNTRAVITLADGSKVYLDSANNGTIAQESNVNVVKENGAISYQPLATSKGGEISYNTLFNPRGSKVISLTLGDGTKVWLNNESSLKYPIAFNGSTREVEITGEAYFDVKHNSKQPFKVHLPNGSVIEDIGTSFNVNAYTDENDIRTTLIEGAVNVKGESSIVNLNPGEQAVEIPQTRVIRVLKDVDISEATAWKNGMFSFESADLQSIMKVLARWYDLDVVYEGKQTNQQLHLEASRNTSLQNVLKVLELTSNRHFKIEGKKVTVQP